MRIQIDGRPADAEALQYRALTNYGHFTAMQVRHGRVRGLDLHLQRLCSATQELFDAELDRDRVRHHIRRALEGAAPSSSVRVDVFRLPSVEGVSVMVAVRPPAEMSPVPRRLRTVVYQRPVAHIKHVGTFAQVHYGQLAELQGFDDALLVGADESVYETCAANIGFVDAQSVVWPVGPMLRGITWQLLDAVLPTYGLKTSQRTVRLSDLPTFRAVFVANSLGVAPVAGVDGTELQTDVGAVRVIQQAYDAVPWDQL